MLAPAVVDELQNGGGELRVERPVSDFAQFDGSMSRSHADNLLCAVTAT